MPRSPFSGTPSSPGTDVADLRTATVSRSSRKFTNKSPSLTPVISPVTGATVRTTSATVETLISDDEYPYDNTDHPPTFIDGITIDTTSSPVSVSVASSEETVSIIQDSTDDETKRKIIDSAIGKPPEILSSVRLPFLEFSADQIDDSIEVGQFERQILKESILQGLSLVSSRDPGGLYTDAKKELKKNQDLIVKQTEAIAEMMSSANTAASGLNVLKMSPQIMQRASDAIKPILFDSEASKKNISESLPGELDDYIKITFPGVDSVDSILSNTSRLVMIMQDMLLTSISIHPSLLSQFSRNRRTKSIFSIPEKFTYDLDGVPGPNDFIPTIDKVFSKNRNSVLNTFIDASVGVRPVTGLLNEGRYQYSRHQWDIIVHLISCLSNEMILSAGIGRVNGSQIANRFLQVSPINNNQYAPFDRVFGESPSASSEIISQFFKTGLGRSSAFQGSFLDYMALSEESLSRDFIVMPFEVDTVIDETTMPYASGKKYFIDLAMQEVDTPPGVQTKRDSIKKFSSQYKSFTSDMSAYMTEMLSLNIETKLSPQYLFARIIQDFREVQKSISSGVKESNLKSLTVAAIFSSIEPLRNTDSSINLGGIFIPDESEILSDASNSEGGISRVRTNPSGGPGNPGERAAKRSRDIAGGKGFRSGDRGTVQVRAPGDELPETSDVPAAVSGDTFSSVTVSLRDIIKMSVVKAYIDLLAISPDDDSTVSLGSLSSIPENVIKIHLENAAAEINSSLVCLVSPAGDSIVSFPLGGGLLHDSEFDISDNLVNLIAKTIREIQKEAKKFSTREGATADYRNSSGNTLMSNCNLDKLIDVICEIYIRMSSFFLPFTLSTDSFVRRKLIPDQERSKSAEKFSDYIIRSLIGGQTIENTQQNIFRNTGINDLSLTLGSTLTKSGKRRGETPVLPATYVSPISEIISCVNKLSSHRFYIKSSLKILESISQSVSSSSSRISRIFEVLSGSLRRDDLEESEKVLYDMFVTNIEKNRGLLSSINDYQASLCTASRFTQVSSDPIFLRRDIDTTRSERLAVRDFIRALRDSRLDYVGGGDNLHLISVGIPAGMISALSSTVFGRDVPISPDFRLGAVGKESLSFSPIISLDIHRHDQSRVTLETSGLITLSGDTALRDRVFDPEIFVMPDSISYNPSTLEPSDDPMTNSPGAVLDKILLSTKFYRIKSGKVLQTINGSRELSPEYKNALVSYLLDLYLYDAMRIRYNDALGPQGTISVTQSGYRLLNEISNSQDLSLMVMNRQGFSRLIDPISLKMKSGIDLLDMVTRRNRFVDPEFTLDNYKMASLLTSTNLMSDPGYILSPRPYERIYHFLYDEKYVQDTYFTDTADRERRKKFDVFTLSVSARHIG
jgi:hypothetical protein